MTTRLTDETIRQSNRLRILAICNIDLMAWVLLRQWLVGLQNAGCEVHVACAPGEHFKAMEELGFRMHAVAIKRTFMPWAHILPTLQLWRIIRNGRFSAINTHSAVGGAVGRAAAMLAGEQIAIYTVHGFLFHENMSPVPRKLLIAIEWLLGMRTAGFMFVSAEDHRFAVQTGIVRAGRPTATIFNGVDLTVFSPRDHDSAQTREFKNKLGIDDSLPIVGIVGRVVREKGHREFLEMAREIIRTHQALFLVVGDTLPSDRDQFGVTFRQEVAAAGMKSHFFFTGQTDLVADFLRIMDIFVLPSYREGFPRSIVEAMSTGLPVISTDIRGCREAVVHKETGLIVPPKDGKALARAVHQLLANPEQALAMGRAGRARAVELYDFQIVRQRFVSFITETVNNGDRQ